MNGTRTEAALPSRPAHTLPAGAWDCHVHVFGKEDRYPFAAERSYTPGFATPGTLLAALDRMGMARAVVVQPTPYGDDHACLIDGLDAMAGRGVGVACFGPEARPSDALLARLAAGKVRALRVHALLAGPGPTARALSRGAAMAGELGWHLEVQTSAERLPLLARALAEFRGPVVLDHMARMRPEDLPRIESLAASRPIYLKLSGLYRHVDPAAARATARTLLARLPGRCVWGSDWPHTPEHPEDPALARVPLPFRPVDAARELDAVLEGSTEALRRALLIDTPEALYGAAS